MTSYRTYSPVFISAPTEGWCTKTSLSFPRTPTFCGGCFIFNIKSITPLTNKILCSALKKKNKKKLTATTMGIKLPYVNILVGVRL